MFESNFPENTNDLVKAIEDKDNKEVEYLLKTGIYPDIDFLGFDCNEDYFDNENDKETFLSEIDGLNEIITGRTEQP